MLITSYFWFETLQFSNNILLFTQSQLKMKLSRNRTKVVISVATNIPLSHFHVLQSTCVLPLFTQLPLFNAHRLTVLFWSFFSISSGCLIFNLVPPSCSSQLLYIRLIYWFSFIRDRVRSQCCENCGFWVGKIHEGRHIHGTCRSQVSDQMDSSGRFGLQYIQLQIGCMGFRCSSLGNCHLRNGSISRSWTI